MANKDCNIFRFTEKLTTNIINFSKSGKIALIDDYYVDPENGKSFVILLKSSFATMKKNGCIAYRQTVSTHDWENFLRNDTNWKIIKQYEDIVTIECDIDSAPECIIGGFIN